MIKQVVTIHADGSISGLQRKKNQGLDLRQFGHADIQRATEILWQEDDQCWTIQVKPTEQGMAFAEYMRMPRTTVEFSMMTFMYHQLTGKAWPGKSLEFGCFRFLAFDEYDDAVATEIELLDAARLRGIC